MRGIDIKSLLAVKTDVFEKMLVTFNSGPVDKIGQIVNAPKYMEENLPKYWCSGSVVDSINTKLFTKLTVNADAGVKFTLKHDNKETHFTTYKKGVNEFVFKLCCRDMKIEISSSQDSAEVNNLVLEYYEY